MKVSVSLIIQPLKFPRTSARSSSHVNQKGTQDGIFLLLPTYGSPFHSGVYLYFLMEVLASSYL